jgi:hypothetical protein
MPDEADGEVVDLHRWAEAHDRDNTPERYCVVCKRTSRRPHIVIFQAQLWCSECYGALNPRLRETLNWKWKGTVDGTNA